MNKAGSRALLGAAAVAFSTSPLMAQLLALPVYVSPFGGTGLVISGDFGRTIVSTLGGFATYRAPSVMGSRISLGLSRVALTVGVGRFSPDLTPGGRWSPEHSVEVSLGILRPPGFPLAIALQGGAGVVRIGDGPNWSRMGRQTFGLGLATRLRVLGTVGEPWVAGRGEFSTVHVPYTQPFSPVRELSGVQIGYGTSVGMSVTMPFGLTLHGAADWSVLSAAGPQSTSPIAVQQFRAVRLTVGVGVHYAFNLPFLPGAPLVSP